MRKLIAALLAAALCVPLAACAPPESSKSSEFDENNIVLSFSAMSDIHQQLGKTEYSEYLINALDYAEELNGGALDLALIAGDLTESTWTNQDDDYSATYNGDIAQLKTTLESALDLNVTPVFYCLGNHDTDPSRLGAEYMSGMHSLFYNMLGEKFFEVDEDDSVPEAGLRHAVVNGYHFLAVNPDTYWNLHGYSEDALAWVDEKLAAITQAEPEKYVFVTAHPPIYDTVFNSLQSDWADADLGEVLQKYPQVIYFSGHIHNVLQDEMQISQNGSFTALDCGSVKYSATMNTINDGGSTFDNSVGTRIEDFSQGLLVQVDGSGNVRVTRCDYYRRSPIKDAWELSYPKADKSHLSAYDNATRQRENAAPSFPEDASLTVQSTRSGLSFTWTAASDDDMVRYYKLYVYTVAEDGTRTRGKTYNLATFTYRYDRVEDMPGEMTFSTAALPSGEYYFEVCPVDVWGAVGGTISATLTVA